MSPAELLCMKVHDPVAIGPHRRLGYLHSIQTDGAVATVRCVAFGHEWYETHDASALEPDGPFYAERVRQAAYRNSTGTPTAEDLAGWLS